MSFQSYSTFVFYNSAADPAHPTYTVYDSHMTLVRTATVPDMKLAGPVDDNVLKSNPGAVFLQGKIYLFGKGENNALCCSTYDGNTEDKWSRCITFDGIFTGGGPTPVVTPNGNIAVFYKGVDGDDPNSGRGPLCCYIVDEYLNQVGNYISYSYSSADDLSVVENESDYTVFYRGEDGNNFHYCKFDTENSFNNDHHPSGVYLVYGPAAINRSDGTSLRLSRG